MRIFFFALYLIFCLGCKEQLKEKSSKLKLSFFDSIENKNVNTLDSLQLLHLNDSAKWILYSTQCNDSVITGMNRVRIKVNKIPLHSLPCKLSYIAIDGDVLTLIYRFLLNDSTSAEQLSNDKLLDTGIEFRISTSKFIGYPVDIGLIKNDTLKNPYSPLLENDKIEFINSNKDKLNSWFLSEAKRRNIVKY